MGRCSLALATTPPSFLRGTAIRILQKSDGYIPKPSRNQYIVAQGISDSVSPSPTMTTALASTSADVAAIPITAATTPDVADQTPLISSTKLNSETYSTSNSIDNGEIDDGAALPPPNGPGDDNDGNNGDDENDPLPSWTDPLGFFLHGLRGKLAADPFFTQKLLVECGLDAAIIIGVNIAARRERFLPEIEFTFCQLAVSLLSDFALVYLLAPSIYRSTLAKPGSLQYKLEFLPSHVFQKSPSAVTPFTKTSRFTTFIMKGVQYSAVGYAMGCLGAASVQGLIWIRERLDPVFVPPPTVQSITGTGMAWSTFMGTSSNARYNLVHGLEDYLYRRSAKAGTLGSIVLRLLNNYAGAAQWVYVTDILDLDVPWVPFRPAKEGKGRKARQRNKK